MAAKAPANEHVLKLFQLTMQYDIDKLLDAAATFQDWLVITNDEKRVIKHQSNKLDGLMTLITENGRAAQFANFILRYNSAIQDTAIAVMNTVGATTYTRPKAGSSAGQVLYADQNRPDSQILQQPDASLKSSASGSTSSPDCMDVDTTDSQPEASSMDIGSKDNLLTQVDSLSSSSQESPDFGYHTGSSKDFQSQTQSVGGGSCSLFQSPRDNLKVIKKNQRSRQRELRRSDISRHQQCQNHFHQSTVVVNNYHVLPKEEQRMLPQWPPPVTDHCHDIIQSLNMEMLTPHLLQNDLLAPPEYQQLDALGTSWKQAKYFLLNVLPTKGQDGFKRFMKCLKEEKEHSGHQDIFRRLESSRV